MKDKTQTNSQAWLQASLPYMLDWIKPHLAENQKVPVAEEIHISVGFPKGNSAKTIGQCFPPESVAVETAKDNLTHYIFIHPALSDPVQILGVVLHEVIHAAVGCDHKHRGPFKTVARACGLEGPLTGTSIPEEGPLREYMVEVASRLGAYPHVPLKPTKRKQAGGGGWVRMASPQEDSYRVVISPRSLEGYGPPLDPWGNEMVEVGSNAINKPE